MSRREAREASFKIIYQVDIHKGSLDEILEDFIAENEISEKDKTYIDDVVSGIAQYKEEINHEIEQNTKNWKVGRISKISRAILQLALYEILKREDIPITVSINEAVEIAKTYDCEQAGRFVNGILGAVQKKIQSSEVVKGENE